MSYTALYRKFRPTKFSEIVGQEHITKTLKNQIIANRVGHAYLLTGGRGTGKTSAAKILARAINCLNPQDGEPCNECEICKSALQGSLTDIVEMDAASNNSVEDIRAIREEVNFLPTIAKYRVYIIDEVHMLSVGAFNALLKTLEEPPAHVKFILATTEPQKLPATILSRCQRFDYKKISAEHIKSRLEYICNESKIKITDDALKTISILAEGAMRDGLSILERCVQEGEDEITEDKVKELVGIPKTEYVNKIVKSTIDNNVDDTLKNIDNVISDGKDLSNLLWEIIKYVKDVLVYKSSGKLDLYNENELKQIGEIASKTTKERLLNIIYSLSELANDLRMTTQKTIVLEVGIMKLCLTNYDTRNSDFENRMNSSGNGNSNLENRMNNSGNGNSNLENRMTNSVNENSNLENRMTNNYNGNSNNENKINNNDNSNPEKKINNSGSSNSSSSYKEFNMNENKMSQNEQLLNKIAQLENKINELSNMVIHNSGTNVDNYSANTTKIAKNLKKNNEPKSSNIVSNFIPTGKDAQGWNNLVKGLKDNGKIMLYTNLMNTTATEVNDMTVGIVFPNGITPFGKSILDKPESVNELTKLVSLEYGKPMQVKYIDGRKKEEPKGGIEDLSKDFGMPVNIIDG